MVYYIISLYFLLSFFLILNILIRGGRPTKTLAWMLAILTIPVGGFILYLVLGRNLRKYKLVKERHNQLVEDFLSTSVTQNFKLEKDELKEHSKLINLISQTSPFPPCIGNKVILLNNGKETFKSIFSALISAKKSIYLEYYIFEEGELSAQLLKLFKDKIKEGVDIKILYDSIGSFSLRKNYIRKLREVGIDVRSFLPIKLGRWLSTINYRNHRKIIIIDDEIGFTGGINISDKYIKGDSKLGFWYDTHLRIEGNAVRDLSTVFKIDWYLASNQKEILDFSPNELRNYKNKATLQIASSEPDSDYSSSELLFLSLITEAKNYIYITNPYVIPGESILNALKLAALSGVDVRILMSKNSDSKIIKWCVQAYYEEFLKAGVKIYLLENGFVHSKIIVSDDTVSTVGSMNLDIRSFEQNYELNCVIYEDAFALCLKKDFVENCKEAQQLNYATFLNRTRKEKLFEGFAKVLSPLL